MDGIYGQEKFVAMHSRLLYHSCYINPPRVTIMPDTVTSPQPKRKRDEGDVEEGGEGRWKHQEGQVSETSK